MKSAIENHYNLGLEKDRLRQGYSLLEFLRTQNLITRHLPPGPLVIYDVGGAAGIYAFWLAGLGHHVHLIDLMPLHIKQAKEIQSQTQEIRLASIHVGDARHLEEPDASADVVLMLGPLYHLTSLEDRLQALK